MDLSLTRKLTCIMKWHWLLRDISIGSFAKSFGGIDLEENIEADSMLEHLENEIDEEARGRQPFLWIETSLTWSHHKIDVLWTSDEMEGFDVIFLASAFDYLVEYEK